MGINKDEAKKYEFDRHAFSNTNLTLSSIILRVLLIQAIITEIATAFTCTSSTLPPFDIRKDLVSACRRSRLHLTSPTQTKRTEPSIRSTTFLNLFSTISASNSIFSRSDSRNFVVARNYGTSSFVEYDFDDDSSSFEEPTISNDFSLDPNSEEAKRITSSLGITPTQHETLTRFASLVVEWNERINLISRKDCNQNVVFGRHVLPSLALAALPDCPFAPPQTKIVDVGTGGGFPGIPLAVLFPESDFLLVDSVGKKLRAVQDMADELCLSNVETHHGRVEEMVDDVAPDRVHRGAYDVCVGRSVAALPKFCFWVTDLMKREGGKLVYIIGGEIERSVSTRCKLDVPIDELLDTSGVTDKRALLFDASDVALIAKESGEVKQRRGPGKSKSNPRKSKKTAKGEWAKRDNSVPKQRGYENFKRYNG